MNQNKQTIKSLNGHHKHTGLYKIYSWCIITRENTSMHTGPWLLCRHMTMVSLANWFDWLSRV